MDGSPVSVHVAVVGIGVDEAPVKTAIDRLEAANHRVLGKKQVAAGAPLLDVLAACIEDAEIDVVLLVAHDTDPVRDAMAPLVTKPLPGFGELLRAAAFSEIGSAAMLLDGEAARCGTTYVFVLPGTVGAVKVALEQLLLPQLDLRTRPTNLASKLPRLRAVPPPPNMERAGFTPASGADAFAEREITDVGTPPPPAKTPTQPPVKTPTQPPVQAAPRVSKTMPPPMPKPVTKTPPMGVVLRATPVDPTAAKDAELITSDAAILIRPAEIVPEVAPAPAPAPEPEPEPEKHADTVAAEQLGAFVMSLEHHAQKLRAEKSQVGPLPVAPSKTQPPPNKTQPPPIKRKTDAEMKADRDASVAEAISKVGPLPGPNAESPRDAEPAPPSRDAEAAPPPTPKRKKNETTPQQWAKAADAMEKISPRAARRDTGSLGPASPVLAQGDRVIVIPQHKPRRALLWIPLALAVGIGGAFGVKALFLSGNRTASAEPQPEQVVKVESVEALPSPPEPAAPGSAATGFAATGLAPTPELAPSPEIEMEPAAADGNLTALAQAHGHHGSAAAPVVAHAGSADSVVAATGSAATGSAAGSDDAPDPRTHPNIAPASPDCDEASCILERNQRECCARYKPAEPPVEAAKPSGPPETLDKAAVIAGIEELKPAVQQCGEEHYAKGTVKITLTVSADGRVTAAAVADSPEPALGQCVAKVLERASFGKTQNGAVFTYPFLF